MMLKFVIFLTLTISVLNASLTGLFYAFAGSDSSMDNNEFADFWFTFDTDGDGVVSKLEFDSGWANAGFRDRGHSPYFFLEMDRIPDEQLTREDFQHMFRLFDNEGDGKVTYREFRSNYDVIFRVEESD